MKQEQTEKTSYQAVSFVVYLVTVIGASTLLAFGPSDLDARSIVLPVIALLTASSVGLALRFAVNRSSKLLTILGTIALTAVFVTVGFHIVNGVAWLVGAW